MKPFSTVESAIAWAEPQDWCQQMAGCIQDKGYHAEGNVWPHTQMVLRQLEKHSRWAGLPQPDKETLIAAALLHDSGKPATTVEEDGKITSRGHSGAGARLARKILRDLGMPLAERERIVQLVLSHGWPPHIVDQAQPEMEVIRTAWLCRNDLLSALTWADATGRTGTGTGFLDAIALWEDLARELDCWDHPLPNANPEAKMLAFEGKDIRFYSPREDYRGHMILMSGLPGAGKDTWLRKNCPDTPVVSLDVLRDEMEVDPTDQQGPVIVAAREEMRQHMRQGSTFAFNATNVTRAMRSRWIRLARDYNYRIRIVYIEPDLATIIQRNSQRPDPVPESVVLRLLEKLDAPCTSEAHEVQLLPL